MSEISFLDIYLASQVQAKAQSGRDREAIEINGITYTYLTNITP